MQVRPTLTTWEKSSLAFLSGVDGESLPMRAVLSTTPFVRYKS
jgi:hypothetical protein